MFRFKSAELIFEREADDSWYQRIVVKYRPDDDDDFRVYTPAQREQYVVDSVVLEWVTSSDDEDATLDDFTGLDVVAMDVNIHGRTIGRSGKVDARQTKSSCFVMTIDETSINELADAWESRAIQLPSGWITSNASEVASALRSRTERARL